MRVEGLWNLSEADDNLFEQFQLKFARAYHTEELRAQRFKYFQTNLARVRRLAEEAQAVHDTAHYGITKFLDYSPDELRLISASLRPTLRRTPDANDCPGTTCNSSSLASRFDWRDDKRNVVTSVGDQGLCGCCWAFSVTELLESAWAIAGRTSIGKLSAQQLLSCDTGEHGCSGGSITDAAIFLTTTSLTSAAAVPYACGNGCSPVPPCTLNLTSGPRLNLAYSCTGSGVPDPAREELMRCYLTTVGPLSVRVNADPWFAYTGGIMRHGCPGVSHEGDHAAQIVGWDVDTSTDPPTPYWQVRNSWGTDWGENGYIRIARGGNVCGIANEVVMGTSATKDSFN